MLPMHVRAPGFVLSDADGRMFHFSELLAAGPVVLTFIDSDRNWMTRRRLRLYERWHEPLHIVGSSLVAISSTPMIDPRWSFRTLCDPGGEAISAYRGWYGTGAVRPLSYLIDRSGHIVDGVVSRWRVAAHEQMLRRAIGHMQWAFGSSQSAAA